MRYSLWGQIIQNVFYFRRSGGWSEANLLEQLTELLAAWHINIKPLLPTVITLVDLIATDVATEDAEQATLAASAPGTNATAAFENPGTTFAIKFATDRVGRSYRGRMYWPVLLTTQVNEGQIASTAAALAIVAGVADMFADTSSVTGNEHVIVSYMNDCAWRTTAAVTAVRTYTYTDLNLDSQRRRLPGRGT